MTKVDVILLCYNQSAYIKQAIDSIFAQKVSEQLVVKIIIADDASTDSTLQIIKDNVSRSPFKVVFLKEQQNLGISKNYQRAFDAADGDYIAVLEGDDYWSAENHIQQHVGFLDKYQECSMSMNRIAYYDQQKETLQTYMWEYVDSPHFVDVEEQISKGNQLGNLSACVFRTKCVKKLPQDLYNLRIADWMLGVMLAQQGNIGLFEQSTSVYRMNPNSQWARKIQSEQIKEMIVLAQEYDKFQNGKYHDYWLQFIALQKRIEQRKIKRFIPNWLINILRKLRGK